MEQYFFKNSQVRALYDFLVEKFQLEQNTEYRSERHSENSPDFIEGFIEASRPDRRFMLMYSSTVFYEALPKLALRFERKKGNLTRRTVEGFLSKCTKVEGPREWLTFDFCELEDTIIDVSQKSHKEGYPLVFDDNELDANADIVAMAKAALEKYGL